MTSTMDISIGRSTFRLWCDMHRPNQAVIKQRHPIPISDELLQDMNQSRVFSKADPK